MIYEPYVSPVGVALRRLCHVDGEVAVTLLAHDYA